jgi:hypothetical protein
VHHCYIGLPQRRIPPCHNLAVACFFGAICGNKPITTLTLQIIRCIVLALLLTGTAWVGASYLFDWIGP